MNPPILPAPFGHSGTSPANSVLQITHPVLKFALVVPVTATKVLPIRRVFLSQGPGNQLSYLI